MFESAIFKLEYPANWDDLYSLVESGAIKEVDISIMTLKEEIGFFRPGIRYDSFIQFRVLDAKEESLKGMLYRSPVMMPFEYHYSEPKSIDHYKSIASPYLETHLAETVAENLMTHGCRVKFDGDPDSIGAIQNKLKDYNAQIADLFKSDKSLAGSMLKKVFAR